MKTFDVSKTENTTTIVMDWYGDLHDVMVDMARYLVKVDIGQSETDIRVKLIKAINNQR